MVVPRTTGCGLKKPEINANIAEPEQVIRMIDSQGNFHPLLASTISDIFRKFDMSSNHLIEFKEFKAFYDIIGK